MKRRQYLQTSLAAILLLVLVIPCAAQAQTREPIREPASIKFNDSSNQIDARMMPSLPIKLGSFSGSGKGYIQIYSQITRSDNTSLLQPSNFEQSIKVSGTYKDGRLEGEWSQEGSIVEYPGDILFGGVHTKSRCSGTFSTKEPVTSRSASARFEGKCTDYFDEYAEGALVRGDIAKEEAVDESINFKLEGGSDGGKSTGLPGLSGGPEAPPGISGIGDVPGPDSLFKTGIGLLLPGIIGTLGGLLLGVGGAGLAEPPTEESPETGPDEDDDRDEDSDEDPERHRPLDPATEHVKHLLDMFEKRSLIDKSPDIKELVDKARETVFDENGELITGEWVKIKSDLQDAIRAQAGEPGSTSFIGETIDGISNTVMDIPGKVKEGAGEIAKVGDELITGIGKGLKDSAEGWSKGIMNPQDFNRGMREGFLDFSDKQNRDMHTLIDAVDQASRKEGDLGAMKVLVDSFVKGESKLWGGLWEIGKGMLPVEELEVLMDPNATIEERAWAFPAAVTKMAALLIGTEAAVTRVPGTGTSSLIPSTRAAVAAEEAAAAGTASRGAGAAAGEDAAAASRGTRAASTEEAGAGAAEKPGPDIAGPKKATAESKAREAEKAAERQAEYAKGDAERAKAEKMFNDPKQRSTYEAGYKDYMNNAQKKVDAMVDTVGSGEKPSVSQVLESSSDPAAMRDLKDAPTVVRKGFNETLNKDILEPTYGEVESFLGGKDYYPGQEIKVESIRTPGKNYNPYSINTDNDIHAIRKVTNPDGSTMWKEVPSEEWKQTYHDSFAKNSGFDVETAKKRFDTVDWDNMTPQERTRKWGELHQQEPGDVFDPTSGRDFKKGSAGTGTDEAAHAAAKKGEGTLTDAEQLGMMEQEKFTKEWNKGTIPHQKEALEQLSKQGREVESLIDGYQKHSKVSDLSPDMKEALKIIRDNDLSPLERARRIKDLGFEGGPAQVSDELRSKIESLKIAKPK